MALSLIIGMFLEGFKLMRLRENDEKQLKSRTGIVSPCVLSSLLTPAS